jgi:hypothetical protein
MLGFLLSFELCASFVNSNPRLQTRPRQAIIPRDVGILVRFSEPPFSTTIQIFRYHGAEFCALAASLVECAGSPFKTSPIPARRGGVSNGVAECLV